jgi:hypothetical protein
MAEVLTGKQLRDRAEGALDGRRPDKETLRNWIRRGADRIDKLTKEVARLEMAMESGGSEAALMMLEDARQAAEKTLGRVNEMEVGAASALGDAKAEAAIEANEIISRAHAEAAEIIASGRETTREHMAKTEAACQARLDKAVDQAERVDRGCQELVDQAKSLEGTYRERVSDIRTEAKALVGLMERFDTLPITLDSDDVGTTESVDELLADIVELNVGQHEDEADDVAEGAG